MQGLLFFCLSFISKSSVYDGVYANIANHTQGNYSHNKYKADKRDVNSLSNEEGNSRYNKGCYRIQELRKEDRPLVAIGKLGT